MYFLECTYNVQMYVHKYTYVCTQIGVCTCGLKFKRYNALKGSAGEYQQGV